MPETTPAPMPDPYPRPGFSGLAPGPDPYPLPPPGRTAPTPAGPASAVSASAPVLEQETAPEPEEHSALLTPVSADTAVPAFAPGLEQKAPPESRPAPAPGPGSVCWTCAHRDCRARRAAAQPAAGGHRAEFAAEHRTAALLQARHPHVILWFGEATQSYWAATPTGLHEAAHTDALLLAIRPHTRT